MRNKILAIAVLAAATGLPLAHAQYIIVEEGVTTGVVGPGVGIISSEIRPRFRQYVIEERIRPTP